MAISPRGDYLAIGDSIGQVQLLTTHDLSVESDLIGSDGMLSLPPLNGYDHGTAVDWPDLPLPLPNIKWSNRTYVILGKLEFSVCLQNPALKATQCHWDALLRRSVVIKLLANRLRNIILATV